jgi:two-component system response regulator DesR
MKKIRVVLAEDHESVRQGLRLLLETKNDIEIVADAANGRVALDRVKALKPDVAVLDLAMPEMNGLAAPRRSSRRPPRSTWSR